MTASFGDFGNTVVDGHKDVRGLAKVWKIAFQARSIGYYFEHLGHGRAEEDDVCILVLAKVFALKISSISSALTWDTQWNISSAERLDCADSFHVLFPECYVLCIR